MTHIKSLWVKTLHKMCEKSSKNGQFLSKVMKNKHYGPISQKKAITMFFLIYIFGMWGRSPTTPNREISWSMNFQNFDLKTHREMNYTKWLHCLETVTNQKFSIIQNRKVTFFFVNWIPLFFWNSAVNQ